MALPYPGWNVVFGEIPAASKWTQLGNNDDALAAGTGFNTGAIPTAAIADGAITFAKLLSTIFGGQVQTQTNAGTAGGTMWWINLGGLKMLWGVSVTKTNPTGTATGYTFTLPSFFTTVQTPLVSITNLSGSANVNANLNSYSTSSVTVNNVNFSGTTAGGAFCLFMLGT